MIYRILIVFCLLSLMACSRNDGSNKTTLKQKADAVVDSVHGKTHPPATTGNVVTQTVTKPIDQGVEAADSVTHSAPQQNDGQTAQPQAQ